MSIEADPNSIIGYVNLGLFAQAVLKELHEIEDNEGNLPPNVESLGVAMRSLAFLDTGRTVDPGGLSNLVFNSYEEISTLFQALEKSSLGVSDLESLVGLLRKVSAPETPPRQRLSNAQDAARFFSGLSERAVADSRFPEEWMPTGVKEFVG